MSDDTPPVDVPAEIESAEPQARKRRGAIEFWPVAALAALVLGGGTLVATRSTSAPTSPTTTTTTAAISMITGTLRLDEDRGLYETGSSCRGTGGYSDIREGTQVTISDNQGAIRAVGSLNAGTWDGATFDPKCLFTFNVNNVPRLDIYQIEVAHRGKLAYTYNDLQARQFTVALTLGD